MKQKILFWILVCTVFFAVSANGWSQCPENGRERLTSEQRIMKQADHVAQSLMLSDDLEKKFIPLYSNYLKDFRSVARMDIRKEFGRGKIDRESLTDEQIDRIINLRFEKCRKILDVREKYYVEFKKILTPRQIMKLYSIERNINKKVQGELNRRYKK